MGLAAASVAMLAGTLSLTAIAAASERWWLTPPSPAALVFLLAGLAEPPRPPFDMPIAETELGAGPYTEYTGLRFALFLLAEYAGIVVFSALAAVLFLGGWRGTFGDTLGPLWTLLKTGAVAFVVIWFRVSWPRLREDQLQRLAWLVLVPLTLCQLALCGVLVVTR